VLDDNIASQVDLKSWLLYSSSFPYSWPFQDLTPAHFECRIMIVSMKARMYPVVTLITLNGLQEYEKTKSGGESFDNLLRK